MKKISLMLVLFAISLAIILTPSNSVSGKQNLENEIQENLDDKIITVADVEDNLPDSMKVLEARFLNMLNHNYLYNEAFYSIEDIVNGSMPALLDLRDDENSDFIKEDYVADYIYNMYGIEVGDYSLINPDFPKMDGFVYIVPLGFEKYSHKAVSLICNEDGSYTLKTEVTVATHDSQEITESCETLFLRNENSQFGFNIIYSNFTSESNSL